MRLGSQRRSPTQAQKAKLLERLKVLAEERDEPEAPEADPVAPCEGCPGASAGARMYTDEQLMEFLAMFCYDVRKAAYNVLLRKAEKSNVRLPGGLELPDQSGHWLRLAASVRANGSRALARADGT